MVCGVDSAPDNVEVEEKDEEVPASFNFVVLSSKLLRGKIFCNKINKMVQVLKIISWHFL